MTEDRNTERLPFHAAGLIILIIVIILAAVAFFVLISPMSQSKEQGVNNQSCRVDRDGRLVDPCVPFFRIVNGPNDTIDYWGVDWSDSSQNPVPSPENCPFFAARGLESWGGMPPDAVITSVRESSWWGVYSSTGPVESGVGSRRVEYRQSPYGMPVFGSAGTISVEVVGLGNISRIKKNWLSLEEVGIVRVIPASKAIERLKRGAAKNVPRDVVNLTIHDIRTGYYTPANETDPQYLEPVWILNATDEIQSELLTIFVSAGLDPQQHTPFENTGSKTIRNFSEIGGVAPQPDITAESNILIGTSGPVGEAQARDSIRKFIKNPDINLTYHGRYIEHNECGRVYYWNYYDFTSADCEFKVETYTGFILSASMTESCTNVGIRDLAEMMNATPERAEMLAVNFTRDLSPLYDKHHMTVTYRQPYQQYDPEIGFGFTGDSASIFIAFDRDTGLFRQYTVFNSNEILQCGGAPVRIGY